ncbi:hypothetical protein ABH912_000520 [Pseudomonas sp. BT76 TE3572]|uniref:hypothetical protein n=1 Tax=Pseudomonas sp. BT76 TE3572 TaxID=3349325 RepID=UPI003D1FAE5F
MGDHPTAQPRTDGVAQIEQANIEGGGEVGRPVARALSRYGVSVSFWPFSAGRGYEAC